MRAAVVTEPGGPEVLQVAEIEDPVPGPDEALVAVHASALNRADLMQRRGGYPAPPGIRPDVPGLEMAGVVEAVGERVQGWKPGDRVMALLGGGGYASRAIAHERQLMAIPEGHELRGSRRDPGGLPHRLRRALRPLRNWRPASPC